MTTLQTIILGVVEGLTEYLPVSSTGHMIIASSFMGIAQDPFTKDFTVIVQFGAILSVVVLYWRRFLSTIEFYKKLMVGVIPALAIGYMVKDKIDALLGDVKIVALALIFGGFILIFIDKWFSVQERRLEEDARRPGGATGEGSIDRLSYAQAGAIGFFQCLAFIPGVSRSAASIIGGLAFRLTRKSAAEFSFFLAVPTMTAATGYKLLKLIKEGAAFAPEHISALLIGNLIAFVVGMITIKAFVGFLTRRGFFVFGVYRILLGAFLLALLATGHSLELI